MGKIFSLTNSFAGRNSFQGSNNEAGGQGSSNEDRGEKENEIEGQLKKVPEKEEGLSETLEEFMEDLMPSEQAGERFESCLWMTIKEIMTRDVITLREDTSLEEVFSLFGKFPYHTFPVVNENNELVGIIDLDVVLDILLLCLVPRSKHTPLTAIRSLGGKAGDVMIRHPVTIPLDATLKDASSLMMKHRFDRVCVIDNGKLAGIISKKDLVKEICRRRKKARTGEEKGIDEAGC